MIDLVCIAHNDPAFPGSFLIRMQLTGHLLATGRDPLNAAAVRLREEHYRADTELTIMFADDRPAVTGTVGVKPKLSKK